MNPDDDKTLPATSDDVADIGSVWDPPPPADSGQELIPPDAAWSQPPRPPAAQAPPPPSSPAPSASGFQPQDPQGAGTSGFLPAATPSQTGQAVNVYLTQPGPSVARKSKVTAGLLALFLGGIGVHKFYLGQIGLGFLYLLFFWTFIPALVAFVEAIVYFASDDERFAAKYG